MSWSDRLMRIRCPPGWKLTRALSEGNDPSIERHVAGCEDCAVEYQRLVTLARNVKAGFPVPDKMAHSARETIGARLRTSALARAPRPARRARWWLWFPVAAGAVTLIAWGSMRWPASRIAVRPAPPLLAESRASIKAIGQARFARAQLQPDEIVRLDEGEIELEIAPLHANERFRVLTEDGEIEVRGTSFKVTVSEHSLAAVHVWRGRVEVRSRGGAFAVLEAGDDWVRAETRPPAAADTPRTAPIREATAVPPPAPAHRRKVASTARAPRADAPEQRPASDGAGARDQRVLRGAVSFGHAWSLLRGGDARSAAAEFAEVARLARGRDIEEDALYWQAVSIGRAGDASGARRLFGEFLDRFPSSSRAGEAAATLGWLLLDAGDRRTARRTFERAARDPSPRVQAHAQEGLRRTQEQEQEQEHRSRSR